MFNRWSFLAAPNDQAQQRRGLLNLHTWASVPAPAVCCSSPFGVPCHSGYSRRPSAQAWTNDANRLARVVSCLALTTHHVSFRR